MLRTSSHIPCYRLGTDLPKCRLDLLPRRARGSAQHQWTAHPANNLRRDPCSCLGRPCDSDDLSILSRAYFLRQRGRRSGGCRPYSIRKVRTQNTQKYTLWPKHLCSPCHGSIEGGLCRFRLDRFVRDYGHIDVFGRCNACPLEDMYDTDMRTLIVPHSRPWDSQWAR